MGLEDSPWALSFAKAIADMAQNWTVSQGTGKVIRMAESRDQIERTDSKLSEGKLFGCDMVVSAGCQLPLLPGSRAAREMMQGQTNGKEVMWTLMARGASRSP